MMENMIGNYIGCGATAKVYEWGHNEIIKIFEPHIPSKVIDYEAFIGDILNKSDVKVPKYINSIEIDGRKALIYERVQGKILAEIWLGCDNKSDVSFQFAKTHFEMHKCSIDKLPSLHNMLHWRISQLENVLEDKTQKLYGLLQNIPEDNKLCHGDFHPLNIIYDFEKYVIIDWNGACSGNALFDVAWSYLTLYSPLIEKIFGKPISDLIIMFANEYLSFYCKLRGIAQQQVLDCLPIVAVRRFYDNFLSMNDTTELERSWLLGIIQRV